MNWLKQLFNKLFLVKEIRSQEGELHFLRWCFFATPLFRIYLHKICLPDYDEHRHTHPWNFISFIIKGVYAESICKSPNFDYVCGKIWRRFSVIRRNRDDAHKIDTIWGPVWTLVFAYGRYQEWGYRLYSPQDKTWITWMDHKTYRKEKQEGLIK